VRPVSWVNLDTIRQFGQSFAKTVKNFTRKPLFRGVPKQIRPSEKSDKNKIAREERDGHIGGALLVVDDR
jgi:hypothetical protein